jgi:tetratricopeptide (TPR) repeat protein
MERYEEAVADFGRAIELDPGSATGWLFNRAQAYQEIGRYGDALADYSRFMELAPGNAVALFGRGRCMRRWAVTRMHWLTITAPSSSRLACGRFSAAQVTSSASSLADQVRATTTGRAVSC